MKINNKLAIAICLYGMCSIGAAAQNPVDAIINSIQSNNADIKANASSLAADSIEIASSNYLEDPKVDFEYLFGAPAVGDKWAIGISQGFEWPCIYAARKRANRSKMTALSYSHEMKRLEVLMKAKNLCLDLINANKQISVQKSIYDNYKNLYDKYYVAYQKGEAGIIDLNKLKIELVNASQALSDIETGRNKIIDDLNALNNGNEFTDLTISNIKEYPVEEFLTLDAYSQLYMENDPENNYYGRLNDALEAGDNVAKMGWFPKFDIGYKYSNEIGDSFNGFTVGASIPLFANRNKVKAAKAEVIANELTRQNRQMAEMARIKSQFAKAVSLKQQFESYKSILGDRNCYLVLEKALEGGQISLLDYLQEVNYFLDAENKMLELEYQYQSIMAELNKYSLLNQ